MRIILFLSSILLVSHACRLDNSSDDLGFDLCQILCTIDKKYPFEISKDQHKVVVRNNIHYYSNYLEKSVRIVFDEDFITCPCMDILLIPKNTNIYDGAYNTVYSIGFSRSAENPKRLKVSRSMAYNLKSKFNPGTRDNYTSDVKYYIKKINQKWELVGDPFVIEDIEIPKK